MFMRLEDAQTMQLAGKINEIEAIDCLCLTADQDPLSILRKTIGEILPGVRWCKNGSRLMPGPKRSERAA